MKAAGKIKLHKNSFKCVFFFCYKMGGGGGGGGGGGAYIGHPMCETTRKPNILDSTRDKEVIHQNRVGWH